MPRPNGAGKHNADRHRGRADITPLRDGEMTALHDALASLPHVPFAARQTLLPELQGEVQTMTALQTEFWDGVTKPKAQRRQGLGTEYVAVGEALQHTLATMSAALFSTRATRRMRRGGPWSYPSRSIA